MFPRQASARVVRHYLSMPTQSFSLPGDKCYNLFDL